jgi:hypothetical protein
MSKMTAEDEEAVALEMEQLEKEAQGNLNGTAPKVGIQVNNILLDLYCSFLTTLPTAHPRNQPAFCSYDRASGSACTRSDKGRGSRRKTSYAGLNPIFEGTSPALITPSICTLLQFTHVDATRTELGAAPPHLLYSVKVSPCSLLIGS